MTDQPARLTDEADADELPAVCAMCGRDLFWLDLPPARDGNAWICGECDAARNFEALDR